MNEKQLNIESVRELDADELKAVYEAGELDSILGRKGQLTRDDLKTMSTEAIVKARREGRTRELESSA